MISKGNGSTEVCLKNLISICRGEVPYDRLRGRDSENFDLPLTSALPDTQEDLIEMLRIYEPRCQVENIDISDFFDDVLRKSYKEVRNNE